VCGGADSSAPARARVAVFAADRLVRADPVGQNVTVRVRLNVLAVALVYIGLNALIAVALLRFAWSGVR
jgi:hypothetical protein